WKEAPVYERPEDPYHKVATEHFFTHTPDKANAFFMAEQQFVLQDTDADYVPLYLANYLLGLSLTSSLWNCVRVSEVLSYDVRGQLNVSAHDHISRCIVYAFNAPEYLEQLYSVRKKEINEALRQGFREEEVKSGIPAL